MQRRQPLALRMGNGYEGEVVVSSARNFGETFFFKMKYTGESFNAPKQWNFRRTWADFVTTLLLYADGI